MWADTHHGTGCCLGWYGVQVGGPQELRGARIRYTCEATSPVYVNTTRTGRTLATLLAAPPLSPGEKLGRGAGSDEATRVSSWHVGCVEGGDGVQNVPQREVPSGQHAESVCAESEELEESSSGGQRDCPRGQDGAVVRGRGPLPTTALRLAGALDEHAHALLGFGCLLGLLATSGGMVAVYNTMLGEWADVRVVEHISGDPFNRKARQGEQRAETHGWRGTGTISPMSNPERSRRFSYERKHAAGTLGARI